MLNTLLSKPWHAHQQHMLSLWLQQRLELGESVPWLLDALPGLELTLEDCDELLLQCRLNHHRPVLAREAWAWILEHSARVLSDKVLSDKVLSDKASAFHHGLYLRIVEWMRGETDPDIVHLLAQQPPPAGLSPAEKTAAVQVWQEKLDRAVTLKLYKAKIFLNHQLYRLTDDPEEKFFRIQQGVESWSQSITLPHPQWIVDHCRQHPGDAARLRQFCVDRILKAGSSGQPEQHQPFITGWYGIVLIGAGEFEAQLVQTLRRSDYVYQYEDSQLTWSLLSSWHPEDRALRAELLDWWYALVIYESHPAFWARQTALFALEEDESRLVQLISEQGSKGSSLFIPDEWCPRTPQSREKLAEIVSNLVKEWVLAGSGKSFSGNQDALWGLLFRLPVSGRRMIDLIQTAIAEDVPGTSFLYIRKTLCSRGLPADTPVTEIHETAKTALSALHQVPQEDSLAWREKQLFWLAFELLREYVRHTASLSENSLSENSLSEKSGKDGSGNTGESSAVKTTSQGMESGRLASVLKDLCQLQHNTTLDDIVNHLLPTWSASRPAGASTILDSLWTLAAETLAKETLQPHPDVSVLRASLMALLHLSRPARLQVSGNQAANSVSGTNAEAPAGVYFHPSTDSASLLKTLSVLVGQESDPLVLLMATRLGHYLACHHPDCRADVSAVSDWWTALGQQVIDTSDTISGLDIRHVIRHEFLVNYLSTSLPGTNASADAVGLWRVLRAVMHRFPDPSHAGQKIWPDMFAGVKELWEQQWGTEMEKIQSICSTENLNENLNESAAQFHGFPPELKRSAAFPSIISSVTTSPDSPDMVKLPPGTLQSG